MGILERTGDVAARTMVLYFLVDASGSMYGNKIGTVNDAIREAIPAIREVADDNADAEIKIAVMEFSTGARWLVDKPEPVESFRWEDLEANGLTDLGDACLKLNEKLSTRGFMTSASGSYAPVIFLMSDGEPTDDYQRGLSKLKTNNWFRVAVKVAIGIGKDANMDVLAEFTGTREAVIQVHTPEELKKWIRFLSVTSSQVASTSSSVGESADPEGVGTKQGDLIGAIKDEKGKDEDVPPLQPADPQNPAPGIDPMAPVDPVDLPDMVW